MDVYKVTTDRAIKDQETFDRIRDTVKQVVGEDAKVVVLDQGMDMELVGQTYYGLKTNCDHWVLDGDQNIVWYPCKQIAEIHADSMCNSGFDVRVEPFNEIQELEPHTN